MLEELYTVEVDGPTLEYDDFVLARRARLLRRVESWRQDSASSFARQCAGRVRDLAVDALRRDRHDEEAQRLAARDTMDDLLEEAQRLLAEQDGAGPLTGYLVDAARFAVSAGSEPRWPANAATVAFVAATAAGAAAGRGRQESAVAAERARQAEWLSGHLLAAV